MSTPVEIAQAIESQLTAPLYGLDRKERHDSLLALLKKELAYACDQNPRFRNYVEHWPVHFRTADTIADLPYLPVGVFKSTPPLALVGANEVKRTLTSSATTGQVPSRVALDGETSKRMTKGVTTIIKDFIGPARRPYLVIDTPENLNTQGELGARGAAIQGLGSFATEVVCCLRRDPEGNTSLDLEKLLDCAAKWRETEVLAYGFTYVIWTQLVQPLQRQGIALDIPNVRVLHSGGWKRLQREAVTGEIFREGVVSVFGCSPDRVIDFYGMVENVGVVYPDCEYGNKHAPAFGEVVVRNPLTLEPTAAGQQGLVQVCSVLPTSFPGFLVLTDDMAEIIDYEECPCGRRGTSFRFVGRVPKAEVRGCGNLETTRHQLGQGYGSHE
jgi:phenylacetate-coenzyme A ligase PaaK-like adenylate-forming protein